MSIWINPKADQFFIAICKKKHHSFVALGVMKDNRPTILARVGGGMCYKKIQAESLGLSGKISYTAYSISFSQYLQFIRLLKHMTRFPQDLYFCYVPDGLDEHLSDSTLSSIRLHGQYIQPYSNDDVWSINPRAEQFERKSRMLSPLNTCRNTAIDLVAYAQETTEAMQYISSFFFNDLLLKNTFDKKGVPQESFYILPAPPSAYLVEAKTKEILAIIYKRMYDLLKKDPNTPATRAKFNALVSLYNTHAGLPRDDFRILLNSIRDWKQQSLSVISPLRSPGFFGQLLSFFNITYRSSTEAMADEIEGLIMKSGLPR